SPARRGSTTPTTDPGGASRTVDQPGVEAELRDRGVAVPERGEQGLLLRGPRPPGGEHVVERRARDDDDAVDVADDPVAGLDRDVADGDRPRHGAGLLLRGAGEREAGGEHGEAVTGERVAVADATVDDQIGDTPRLRAGGEHLAPVAEVARAAHV